MCIGVNSITLFSQSDPNKGRYYTAQIIKDLFIYLIIIPFFLFLFSFLALIIIHNLIHTNCTHLVKYGHF